MDNNNKLPLFFLMTLFLFLTGCVNNSDPISESSNPGQLEYNVISPEQADCFVKERIEKYSNSLGISITNVDIAYETNDENIIIPWFEITVSFTNQSYSPLTFKKPCLVGFEHMVDSKDLSFVIEDSNGEQIFINRGGTPRNCMAFNDFITIVPRNSIVETYRFFPNSEITEYSGKNVLLIPGNYSVYAKYKNHDIGYKISISDNHNIPPEITIVGQIPEKGYGVLDMNTWVGEISSDRELFIIEVY